MKIATTILLLLATTLCLNSSTAFAPNGIADRQSSPLFLARGRGSFKKEFQNDSVPSSSSSAGGLSSNRNWINTKKSVKELPEDEGKVKLLDTGAFLLINKQTNPNGAVSVMKYKGETHCFDANCPQCKVPMTKAYPLPPNEETNKAPRVVCDLCQSTYNLRTGAKVTSQQPKGIFGGIAKAVLGSQESGPLSIYQLGEKNGKVMFSMD